MRDCHWTRVRIFFRAVGCLTWVLVGSAAGQPAERAYGAFSLDARLRFETASIAGTEDAENLSLRLRPGYATPEMYGLRAMLEGEFTAVRDKADYNAAGVHGDAGKAVIADPENAQLDQLWAAYGRSGLEAKVGRQVIAWDNHRWIGHVGWRQNRQTYDAVAVQALPVDGLTLRYGYIDKVIRIFGDDAPKQGANAESFGSESHLVQVAASRPAIGSIVAYAYLLELEDSPPAVAGSDTFGLSYQNGWTLAEQVPVGLYLEYARQSDGGDHPLDYQADYAHAAADIGHGGFKAAAGYELLGSDRVGEDEQGAPVYASVQTPLATLHKFNGFADRFLVTPPQGLEDRYVQMSYTHSLGDTWGPITLELWYHDFSSDKEDLDLGDEFDAVLVKPLPIPSVPGSAKLLAKYADYRQGDIGDDTERFSLELDYTVTF